MNPSYILTLSCADRPGLVARVAGDLLKLQANILEAQQFNDLEFGRFFMRIAFETGSDPAALEAAVAGLCTELGMDGRLRAVADRMRVLILTSRFDHCLGDLLYRSRVGELNMEVVGIVSNHPAERLAVQDFGKIPFHYLPVTPETKVTQEAQIKALVAESGAELVVLARYMQILSPKVVDAYRSRIINIHHSFLPAFIGANPYRQAHDRGVKLIGATAHYVTEDLDEGPILDQEVTRVSHRDSVTELTRKGRDLETIVLARAVRAHLEHRVLVYGRKTVVFG